MSWERLNQACRLFVEVDHLRLPGGSVFDFEANARLDFVHPLTPGCSGVNVQHIPQITDSFYAEDMTMSADENIRWIVYDVGGDAPIPAAGPSADMCHPETQAFELHAPVLQRADADGLAVDVSPDGLNGSQLLELIENLGCTDVTCVENQIDVPKEFRKRWMEEGVGVRKDT